MNNVFAVTDDDICATPDAVAADIRRAVGEVPGAAHASVMLLLTALARHDGHTYLHSLRVGRWAYQLAQVLGHDRQGRDQLLLAGLLHDIGKINIPRSLLIKPGPLTPPELKIMQTHVSGSAQILQYTPPLGTLAPIVAAHHERPDGRGYPRGLATNALLPAALILAVADAVDAMTSWRPYAPPLPTDQCIAVLQAGAGASWSAMVVTGAVCLLRGDVVAPKREAAHRTTIRHRRRALVAGR